MKIIAPVLIVACLVAGCSKSPDNAGREAGSSRTAAKNTESGNGGGSVASPAVAGMEGDHQVVHVVVTAHGYDPASVQLKAGVPAKIVFKQTTDSMCLSQVKIPDFGVPATDLPVNQETTVEFTPGQSGNFTFTCGMEMARGTIIVAS